jgi:multiple sugar transport system substrate-binding protein
MKKYLAILMVVMIVVTISFVGCKTTTTAETTAAATTAAATTEAAAAEAVESDAGAAEVAETTAAAVDDNFTIDDIPEIANKADLSTIVETGATFDLMLPYIAKFTEKTGVKVNIERIATPVVYSKENVELVAGTGVYDLAYVETAWTDEWAQYMIPMDELAAKYETVEAFQNSLATQAAAPLSTCMTNGKIMVVPFYTYQTGMFYRSDVFTDPTEMAAFKAKYGYDLAPATTAQQLLDQATFLTRKKGELLKGKPVDKDVYGMAAQASAYQANDEFSTYLWGNGGDYVDVIKDASGAVTEFKITKKNTDLMIQTMEEYVARVKTMSPGVLTANFDFCVGALGDGSALMLGMMYSNCFSWNNDVLTEGAKVADPDAKLGIASPIGKKSYTGAWSFGVAKAAKNPEAAYWLIRWLSSKEAQVVVMRDAGQLSTRMDVVNDPMWNTPEMAYPFGLLTTYLKECWTDQAYADFLANEYYFNAVSGGKVTEMHMNTLSKGFSGELSPSDCIKSLNEQMVDLVTKFDVVPITVEDGITY